MILDRDRFALWMQLVEFEIAISNGRFKFFRSMICGGLVMCGMWKENWIWLLPEVTCS